MIGDTRLLLDSIHFNEMRSVIRSRSVAWEALSRSEEISDEEATYAKLVENVLVKKSVDNKELNVNENLIRSLVQLVGNTHNKDCRKSSLNLVAELLSSETHYKQTVEVFQEDKQLMRDLFQNSFQSEQEINDSQFTLIAAFNMVSLLTQESLQDSKLVEELLTVSDGLLLKILANLQELDTSYVCIRLLQELAVHKGYKLIIWKYESQILPTLFTILRRAIDTKHKNTPLGFSSSTSTSSNSSQSFHRSASSALVPNANNLVIQIQYYSLLLIWVLMFERKVQKEYVTKYLTEYLNLLKIMKVTIKEKISRVSISILLQCLVDENGEVKDKKLIKQLLLLGNALPVVESLTERKYTDQELKDDLVLLKDILEQEYKELTSFDEYIAEVDSKLLCWSPPHIDNGFWVDNIDKFKLNNWELFKKLINILEDIKRDTNVDINESKTKTIIEVALSDIAHVVELLPESIDVLGKTGGKLLIMELLNHSDSRVKYEALKATQAIIGYRFR
ncbi:V-ATPase subunit H [Nakaseomyces glabratus]|nr:H(+)-transporting V1 sector ATPase subunit H [Nakaseomyces glabratus]